MHGVKRSGKGGGYPKDNLFVESGMRTYVKARQFSFLGWGKGRFRGQENWYSYRFIINWCSADLSFNFSSGLTGPISIRTFRICVWLFVLWYLYLFLKYCYSYYVQYKWVYIRSNDLAIRRSAFFYCPTTTDIRETKTLSEWDQYVCYARLNLGILFLYKGALGVFCLP